MTFMQSVLLFLLVYLCVYSLLNRLCQCIEHCATAKAFGKSKEAVNLVKKEHTEGTEAHELSENHANQYR